jgi:GT2 family glycosyltransferase
VAGGVPGVSAPVDFTLVVVAYHRPASLRRLLAGVHAGGRAGDGTAPRVVVVNVDADADVAAVGDEFAATVVSTSNRGYAAAVNRGRLEVRDAITVFAGDDLQVDRTSVHRLVAAVATGEADAAAPRIVDGDGRDEGSVRALPTPGRLLVEWAMTSDRPRPADHGVQKWRRPTVTQRVEAFDAALVAVRTSVLVEHPLPEEYFLYWEELDWCWQLRAAGCRAVVVPEAVVHHAGGRTDVRADKQRLLARNAVRCVYRTQGRWAAVRAWPVVVLWQTRLLVVDVARRLLGRGDRVDARLAGVRAAFGAWREFA